MLNKLIITSVLLSVAAFQTNAQTYTEHTGPQYGDGWEWNHICFYDIDSDGLMDVLIGDYSGEIKHYEQASTNSDSLVLINTKFSDIDDGVQSAVAIADIDGDGLLELLNGGNDGELIHYEQDAPNSYSFSLVQSFWNGIDVGAVSKPFFADFEGDGILDLLVGHSSGTIHFYRQRGVDSTGFDQISTNFADNNNSYAVPFVADINNNGQLDLIIGSWNGLVVRYEQDTAIVDSFYEVDNFFNSTDYGQTSSPAFADLNGNGLLEMLMAEYFGPVRYYEQTSDTSADFTGLLDGDFFDLSHDFGSHASPLLYDIDANGKLDLLLGMDPKRIDIYEQDAVGSTTFILTDSAAVEVASSSNFNTPALTDLDGNGKLDLLFGYDQGRIYHFEQDAVNARTFTLRNNFFSGIMVNQSATPAVSDIDGDGLLDLIIGEGFGNVHRWEQNSPNDTMFSEVTSTFLPAQGFYAAPTFTNLDGDNLIDLMIGNTSGQVRWYEQDGVDSSTFSQLTFDVVFLADNAKPTFGDVNNDGKTDLLVGDGFGGLHLYLRQDIVTSTGETQTRFVPTKVTLHQNYPNPFNPTTTIKFELDKPALVNLKVYNMLGQEVRTLAKNRLYQKGQVNLVWDGKDNAGSGVASGTYIYRLAAGNHIVSRKLMLMK